MPIIGRAPPSNRPQFGADSPPPGRPATSHQPPAVVTESGTERPRIAQCRTATPSSCSILLLHHELPCLVPHATSEGVRTRLEGRQAHGRRSASQILLQREL